MTSKSAKPAKIVVFVVFPKTKMLDLAGPMQVFADAGPECGHAYEVIVSSRDGGEVASDTPLPISTAEMSTLIGRKIDTLIVAGGVGALAAAKDAHFLEATRCLALNAKRVGSVCTGAFILAQTGLLAGRRAVTHWQSCDLLGEMFPDITVAPDAIYVRDDKFWTSAGVTAGIDMSLAMVAEDAGRASAMKLARSLVCYMVRPGGQSQFSTSLRQQSHGSSGRFDDLNAWMADNLTATLSVEDLARRAMMSPRNFARLYKQHAGISPAKAVETVRLTAACRMLEETDLPLTSVARQAGFIDDERLRRAMMRAFKVAPGEYRQRFGNGHV